MYQRVCGFCNYVLPDRVTKCPNCQKSVCLNCGNILGIGTNQCPRCGQKTLLGAFDDVSNSFGSLAKVMMAAGAVILVIALLIMFL